MLGGIGIDTPDVDGGVTMLELACRGGDVVGCWHANEVKMSRAWDAANSGDAATINERSDAATQPFKVERAALVPRLLKACSGGSTAACEVMPCEGCGGGGSSADRASQQHAMELCRKGSNLGCAAVLESSCGDSVDNGCLERLRAEPDLRAMVEQVEAACTKGVVESCEVLPGRKIPYATLCAAHDHRACEEAKRIQTSN